MSKGAAGAVHEVPPDLDAFLARLADASGAAIAKRWRTPVTRDVKADRTPVTLADVEAEQALRGLIAEQFPGHGILGEEFGDEGLEREFVWVLDPIDGTRSFLTGRPTFVTLIALCRAGRPVAGVIDQPITGERWQAVPGAPARLGGAEITTRKGRGLADAVLYTSAPEYFEGADAAAFARLKREVDMCLYNADGYAFGLLAGGWVDIVVECRLKPYDYCAVVPVVEGAGGAISDWQGAPLGLAGDGTVVACADPALHPSALDLLRR